MHPFLHGRALSSSLFCFESVTTVLAAQHAHQHAPFTFKSTQAQTTHRPIPQARVPAPAVGQPRASTTTTTKAISVFPGKAILLPHPGELRDEG